MYQPLARTRQRSQARMRTEARGVALGEPSVREHEDTSNRKKRSVSQVRHEPRDQRVRMWRGQGLELQVGTIRATS